LLNLLEAIMLSLKRKEERKKKERKKKTKQAGEHTLHQSRKGRQKNKVRLGYAAVPARQGQII